MDAPEEHSIAERGKAPTETPVNDPHRLPPSIEEAELHHRCNRLGWAGSPDCPKGRCPCCGSVEAAPLAEGASTDEITGSGATLPLFFQYSRLLIVVSGFMLLLGANGVYFTVKNNCKPTEQKRAALKFECSFGLTTLVQTFEVWFDPLYAQSTALLLVIVLSISFWLFRATIVSSKAFVQRLLAQHQTPSSYSVMVHGLSPEQQTLEYIEAYINARLQTSDAQVVKFSVARKDCTAINLRHEVDALGRKLAALQAYAQGLASKTPTELASTIAGLQRQVASKQAALARAGPDAPDAPGARSVAYVTLRYQAHAAQVREQFTVLASAKWFLFEALPSACRPRSYHLLRPAPEPEDIIWENQAVSGLARLLYQTISLAVVFLLVLLTAYVIELSFQFRRKAAGQLSEGFAKKSADYALNLLAGAVVPVSNALLTAAYMYLVQFEKPYSKSDQLYSTTVKLFFVQFVNTIFVPLFEAFYSQGQQEYNPHKAVFLNELSSLALTPVLGSLDLAALLGHFRKKQCVEAVRAGAPVACCQQDFNALFDPQQLEVYTLYGSVLRSFFISCLFLTHVPSIAALNFLYQLVQFRVNRFMVFHRYGRLPVYGARYSQDMVLFTAASLPGIAWIFVSEARNTFRGKWAVLLLSLVGFLWLLCLGRDTKPPARLRRNTAGPRDEVLEELRVELDGEDEALPYEQVCDRFHKDYESCNPSSRAAPLRAP